MNDNLTTVAVYLLLLLFYILISICQKILNQYGMSCAGIVLLIIISWYLLNMKYKIVKTGNGEENLFQLDENNVSMILQKVLSVAYYDYQ